MRATLLLIAATMTGCMHWVPARLPPAEVLAAREKPPGKIRFRLDDSTRLVLHDHVLRGDSVIGYLKSNSEPGALTSGFIRRAVPLGAIRALELHRANEVGTAVLVTGMAATGVLMVASRGISGSRVAIPCGMLGEPCPARVTPD